MFDYTCRSDQFIFVFSIFYFLVVYRGPHERLAVFAKCVNL